MKSDSNAITKLHATVILLEMKQKRGPKRYFCNSLSWEFVVLLSFTRIIGSFWVTAQTNIIIA